jgi:hypothetical protein
MAEVLMNLILVEGRTYPIARRLPRFATNTVLVCPWTGDAWARIDRGAREWNHTRIAKRGLQPWPGPFCFTGPSGSLYTDYDVNLDDALLELPRPLLTRELSLIEELTRATLSCDNGATFGESTMTPDLLQEIATLRTKVADGTITDDQLRDALKKMRAGRVSAVRSSATKRASVAVKTNPDDALAAFLS